MTSIVRAPYGATTIRDTRLRWQRRGQRRRPARRRRPRQLFVLILVVVVLAATGAVVWRRLTNHQYLGTDGWPADGQGAYRLGHGAAAVSAHEQPVPIASVAKVMTAWVVVHVFPLATGQDGPALSVSRADVADTERRRRNDESVVAVASGEVLTERQALTALLLPSANNVAVMLARWVAGSEDHFVAEMNGAAASLHMDATTYTDPSGYDPGTVSTAADQLRLAEAVVKQPVLAQIMAMSSAHLPVAGTVRNTDDLLGKHGFVGLKTGSTDAAGGCFMFHAVRVHDGRRVDLIGVVLGQPGQLGQPLLRAGLVAAEQLADRVAPGP